MPEPETQTKNYYSLLGLSPTVSVQEIRRAYRDLSKLYHPDTTQLPAAIATQKFQQLNEAYATLSNPQRRLTYDQRIGYSRISVMQAPTDLNMPVSEARKYRSSNAYLDPTDRPLSAGELFALFILGLTFVACLVLVVAIGVTQGEIAWRLPTDFSVNRIVEEQVEIKTPLDSSPATPLDSSPASIRESEESGESTPSSATPASVSIGKSGESSIPSLADSSPPSLEASPPSLVDSPPPSLEASPPSSADSPPPSLEVPSPSLADSPPPSLGKSPPSLLNTPVNGEAIPEPPSVIEQSTIDQSASSSQPDKSHPVNNQIQD